MLRAYDVFLNDKQTSIEALSSYSGQTQEYISGVFYGTDDYRPAMIVLLDPNRNKMIDFYVVMKKNEDIDPNTPYDINDYIDHTIYEEALNVLIERGHNKELYEKLLEESKVNNY